MSAVSPDLLVQIVTAAGGFGGVVYYLRRIDQKLDAGEKRFDEHDNRLTVLETEHGIMKGGKKCAS